MKSLVLTLFIVFSLYAKVIDKIEIVVNNEPITSYDITAIQKKLNIPKQDAINYLINQALLKSAIKERGIYVDDFDIDNAMQKIAAQNGMTLFNFKDYLLQQGQLQSFKKKLKLDIEKQKLLKTLSIRVTPDEMKAYYKTHQKEFMLPSKIDTTMYSSKDKKSLIQVMKNPMSNVNVNIQDKTFNINNTNPKLMSFLAKVKEKSFSPIVNINHKFQTFYIKKKYEPAVLPFKMVEGFVYNQILRQKQNQALNDFIAKLKLKANIEYK